MAVKYVTVKCPECGANLPIEKGRQAIFCSYCGSQIMLVDENEYKYKYEVTHHHVDEAEIMRAEAELLRVKAESEKVAAYAKLKEKQAREDAKRATLNRDIRITAYFIALIFAVISVVRMSSGENSLDAVTGVAIAVVIVIITLSSADAERKRNKEIQMLRDGKIKLTGDAINWEDENVGRVRSKFESLGFQNIKTVNLKDLTFGILKKAGNVEYVSINGEKPCEGWYNIDSKIVIKYHDFPNPDEIRRMNYEMSDLRRRIIRWRSILQRMRL